MNSWSIRWLALGATAVLAPGPGCIDTIAEHESTIGEVTRDCVVPPPTGAPALGAPASLEYPDDSLWLWESVGRADGAAVAGAAARVAGVDAACGGITLLADATGAPVSVLALTAAEQQANATRGDGKRLALAPTGGVVAGGVGYLYYEQVLRGPGFFDVETLGTGLCTLAPGASTCVRLTDGAGSTLLWTRDEQVLNQGGLVVADASAAGGARALLAGCRAVASFDDPCTIAGAPVAQLAQPAAYRVWNGFQGWVSGLTNASAVANVAGALTIAPYGGGYLAISLDIFASRVTVARAADPKGRYGHFDAAFAVVPSASFFVSGGREHAALRPDDRSLVVSYATDGAAAPGLHLVTFRFHGDVP